MTMRMATLTASILLINYPIKRKSSRLNFLKYNVPNFTYSSILSATCFFYLYISLSLQFDWHHFRVKKDSSSSYL